MIPLETMGILASVATHVCALSHLYCATMVALGLFEISSGSSALSVSSAFNSSPCPFGELALA